MKTSALKGRIDRFAPTNPTYGPGLCDWRDKKHQLRNGTSVGLLTDPDGTTLTLPAWTELTGQNANKLTRCVNEPRQTEGYPPDNQSHCHDR